MSKAAKQHKLDLNDDDLVTLSVALKGYVDSFGDTAYHPNSQIGQTHRMIKRIKAIRHGDKSQGAYANS